MATFKEAVSHTQSLVTEYNQRYYDGLLDRMDIYDYLNSASDDFLMQAEHLNNRSDAIAQLAQNLLNSTRAQCKQG